MIQLNKTNFQTVKTKFLPEKYLKSGCQEPLLNFYWKKVSSWRFQLKKPWDSFVILVLSILITIPLFIIFHENLINPNWVFSLDRIVLFIVLLGVIHYTLYSLRTIIIICVVLYFLVLIYGSLFGNFNFNSVFDDYNSMLYSMNNNPYPQDIIIAKLLPFPNKTQITKAIEYENPKVRNFAVFATSRHFKNIRGHSEYRTIIQCFAVFKEINSRWNYVNDPKDDDYIATASESLLYFSGDCDDHSILMAATIKAIGGTPRLIHTKGHIYPEIWIGTMKDLENVNYLIKNVLFAKESYRKQLGYHIDERGQVWLNLDYTAKYPGGPFMSEEILGALTLE